MKRIFDTMKNGYHRYQVEDYIETMELRISSLNKRLELANFQNETMQEELTAIKQSFNDMSGDLQIKEKAANDMARMAMREANRIIDTANDNADVIIQSALTMARGILLDIARIGNDANDLKDSMKEELARIAQALDEFETPAIPDVDLLKREIHKR